MRTLAVLILVLSPVGAQLRVPLDGTWDLAPDRGVAPPEYALRVAVPAAFETALGTDFDGIAWYRRPLPLAPEWRGAAIRVEFDAVATHAQVFCNGQLLGEHLGGWTPFRVDLTPALRWDGGDRIEVRVDERVGHATQGFLPIVQPHFGGIWQGVTLCVDRSPVVDRLTLSTFGRWLPGTGAGVFSAKVAWLPATDVATAAPRLRVEVLDGSLVDASSEGAATAEPTAVELRVAGARAWSPGAPNLYTVRVSLLAADGELLDRVERRVGFRSLEAKGTTIRWNGAPLQVRGVLHWGYSPPYLAPPRDPAFWRRQLEDFRSLGFNTLKCCLWVPPPCVYDLCDELGLLCWQEYPTWHAPFDQQHKQQLAAEYGEFFRRDGSHCAIAFRSITCETGQSADLDVIRTLFDACHAAVPETLVVDDSSWIGWQRITDFWDEHPYGNNRWWPGRLAEFAAHIAQHGEKPLLLGECIAADTWTDLAAWEQQNGTARSWWQPDCLADQRRFEQWIEREFGAATLHSLAPIARDYAMATRRYQIECLRRTLPAAGYVVSVARDFAKARMGLYDDCDRLKWNAAAWAWHGDTMLCLDTPGDRRAFVVAADAPQLSLRVVHGTPPSRDDGAVPEPLVSPPLPLPALPPVLRPTRHLLAGAAAGRRAEWPIWLLPPFDDTRPDGLQVVDHLDPATLSALEAGGRVLLRVDGKKGAPRSEPLWYLKGAPFAPPHPFHERVPAAMLLELQAFDLDGGRAMPWAGWIDQVDPILAFWETHDIPEVRAHLFAFDCRVGLGRLAVSCLDRQTDAGRYVEQALLRHLHDGPAPQRALSDATVMALRQLVAERTIPLAVWRFRADREDRGRAEKWFVPDTAGGVDTGAAPWRDLRAGSHWENQAEDLRHLDGVAWYRIDLTVPADWPDVPARAVFEGVDDSFEFWLDGESLGRRGDPETKVSVWLEPQTFELGQRLRPGPHTLALRVVDHTGAGGLWKPAYLTTGPTGEARSLLQ